MPPVSRRNTLQIEELSDGHDGHVHESEPEIGKLLVQFENAAQPLPRQIRDEVRPLRQAAIESGLAGVVPGGAVLTAEITILAVCNSASR